MRIRLVNERGCYFNCKSINPGETNSSYIMEEIIDFLISDNLAAQCLREKFVFKIIPMINPDGVIAGNSKCSLAGIDLNHQWQSPNADKSPEIFRMKKLIQNTLNSRYIHIFCDIHGNSSNMNIFMNSYSILTGPDKLQE